MIIVGIFFCKLCVVLVSSGFGVFGGVFILMLFIGFVIGMLYGCSLGLWFFDGEEIIFLFGLIGMVILLVVIMYVLIMLMLMICEMIGEY